MSRRSFLLIAGLFLLPVCPAESWSAAFTTSHFSFQYDEQRLTPAQAETAARDAERAYEFNQERFPNPGPPEIRCDLTPRFLGATGYAQPDRRPPVIAVRIPDLEYLGLDEVYVLRHEIAHIFSGRLAGGPMGEGLADMVAGGFGDLPLGLWWGSALQSADLWVDPDALFVTGDYATSTELDARQRIASYTEPALLLLYLSQRFGFDRVLAFLPDYGRARHSLESNQIGRQRRGFRTPDPEAVRAVFSRYFGHDWPELRSEWERQMAASPGTEPARRRLVIRQRTYAAIRNFEMWLTVQRGRVSAERIASVRQAFTAANAAIRSGQWETAETRLREAEGLVNQLKRPVIVVRASFGGFRASDRGCCLVES
jgi:hypothetical protein